jgi:hypothetical protein
VRNNFGLAGRAGRSSALLRRLAALTNRRARIVTDSVDPDRLDEPSSASTRRRPSSASAFREGHEVTANLGAIADTVVELRRIRELLDEDGDVDGEEAEYARDQRAGAP